MLCILLPMCFAAYTDFNVIDNINANPSASDVDLGNIVVQKSSLVPQTIGTSTGTGFSLYSSDTLVWNGAGNLEIYNSYGLLSVLSTGNSFTFTQLGTYTFKTNSSEYQTNLLVDPQLDIQISDHGSDIDVSLDKHSLNNLQTQQYVYLDSNLTRYQPGYYNIRLNVSSDTSSKFVNRQIYVPSIEIWSVKEHDLSTKVLKAGDYMNIGFIRMANDGNHDTDINIDVDGDIEDFINVEDVKHLSKDYEQVLNVLAQIPEFHPEGTYNGTIRLHNSFNETTYNITIVIQDKILPEIESIEFSHNLMLKPCVIEVIAKDNIDVDHVTLDYLGNIVNLTKDQQFFKINMTIRNSENQSFLFCAYDGAGNHVCENVTKDFERLSFLEYSKNVKVPTLKTSVLGNIDIFKVTDDPLGSAKITLVHFADNWKSNVLDVMNVRLKTPSGDVLTFNNVNDSFILTDVGMYQLQIRGENQTDYEGQFKIETNSYLVEYPNIYFSGKIGEYTTPESINMEWYGSKLDCTVFDTGVYDTSKYKCNIEYPIDTDFDNLMVPTSVKEKELADDDLKDAEMEIFKKSFGYVVIIMIVLSIMICAIVYIYFLKNVQPNMLLLKKRRGWK